MRMKKILHGISLSIMFLLATSVTWAQNKTISGKITNEKGEAISGASVLVVKTTIGTQSDASGAFSISVPESATKLVVSAVGYESKQANITGNTVNVSLASKSEKLDEVVVIGYGTANKRDLTGSITKVAGKEVADKPNTNPISSLQGKVAGLSIVNNGTPGAAPDIRIRGTNSISGSINPLYVVDGIFNDNIDYLNPNDIESIEVLKDPSSLAIFGIRGANGVITITTKKGKIGRNIINFSTSYGTKKLVDKIQMADADLFKTLFAEENSNYLAPVVVLPDYTKFNANTDWVDAVTRTGKFNANSVSLSNATENNKFYIGIGNVVDEGIIINQKLDKILINISDEVKIKKYLKIGFNFNTTRINKPYRGDDGTQIALDQARKVLPIVSANTISVRTKNPYGLDSTVQDLYYDLPSIQNSGVVNPLFDLQYRSDTRKNYENRYVASVFAELNLMKNLSFRTTFYADYSNVANREYTPLFNGYDASISKPFLYSRLTSVSQSEEKYRKTQADYILNYKINFGDHNLTMMTGFTTSANSYEGLFGSANQSVTGNAIPNDSRFWYLNNGFEDVASKVSSSRQFERNTASFLLRGLYNFKGKYYLNASYRRDGSSTFPNNVWNNYWAIGTAWELTKENFMQNVKQINFLKLKASTGVLGVQSTSGYDYPAYPILQSGTTAVFGENLYTASRESYKADPDLNWEQNVSSEVGLEIDAFNRRLHFEANYYIKNTKKLLLYTSGGTGVQDGLKNRGSLRNSGLEFSASWMQNLTKDLTVTISGNLTTYKNKVIELAENGQAIFQTGSKTEEGSVIGAFYGYIVEGLYQSYADKLSSPVNTEFAYGPGDFKFKDVNGDGIINAKDRTYLGNPTPDFAYGGSVNFKYKGFDLGFDIGGVYGNEIFRTWGATESPFQRVNYPAFKVGRWHGEGTSNWDPILGQGHRINYEASSYNIEDGSYVRLRNIQFGYNITSSLLAKAHISNARLFVNMQNPKTWKNNMGYSPEQGGGAVSFGVDRAGGALPSVTTFGLNVTF